MARVSLDLKHFKHVKSGKDTTTLQHKDGHMLEIAHKSLSPEFQEQLNALCNGGYAKKMADGGEIAPIKKENYKPSKESKEQPKKMAYGGDPQEDPNQPQMSIDPMLKAKVEAAEAQQLQQVAAIDNVRQAVDKNTPEPKAPTTDDKSPGFMDALSGIGKGISDFVTGPHTGQDPLGDLQKFITQPHIAGYQAPPEQPQAMAQAEAPQAETPQAPSQLMPEQPKTPESDPQKRIEDLMSQGYNKQMQGIEQQAQAQGKLGEEQAKLIDSQVKAQQESQLLFRQQFEELNNERKAHMADIQAGHIDPEKYWQNHSKIASGIGMILAGFNPAGGPNAAVNFLQHQMDNNIKAQQANLDSDQNLLKANLQQFGNLKDATDMTRIMQTDLMVNELKSAAAKATQPMAKAAALQAAGKLQTEMAPQFMQFALRRAMMQGASQGASPAAIEKQLSYMRVMNPEMAKSMEQRYIPNVGMASVPVPDGIRKEITAKQILNNEAQDLLKYSKTHTNLIPGTAEYNFGTTKALALQQQIREAMLGTVFRESEKPLLEKFVNENPAGAFKMLSTQPQLKAIIQTNAMGLNQLKSSYGLPTQTMPDMQSSMQQAQDFIKKNPNSELAQKIKNHPAFKGK